MSHNPEIQAEAALAQAQEQQERIERLDSQGLCHDCGEVPQNPFVRAPVCLDCYHSNDQVGCAKIDCPNPHYGSFQGSAFCKAHLSDVVHSSYYEYLNKRQQLEEAKERFDKQVQQLGEHPKNYDAPYGQLSDPEQDLFDSWVDIKHQAKRVNFLKREIKQAMKQDVQLFPDEYQLFG
jgi:hypothetical protein